MEALQNMIANFTIVDYITFGLLAIFMIVSIISMIVAGNRQKTIYAMEDKVEKYKDKYLDLKETANAKLKDKNSLIKDLKAEIEDLNNNTIVEDNSEEIEKLKSDLEKKDNEIKNISIAKDNEIKKISKQYEDKIIAIQAKQGETIIDQTELDSTKKELEDLKKELAEQVIRNAEYETLIEELKQDATEANQKAADAAKAAAKPKAAPKPKKEKKEIKAGEVDWSKYNKTALFEMATKIPGCPVTAKTSKSDLIALIMASQK